MNNDAQVLKPIVCFGQFGRRLALYRPASRSAKIEYYLAVSLF